MYDVHALSLFIHYLIYFVNSIIKFYNNICNMHMIGMKVCTMQVLLKKNLPQYHDTVTNNSKYYRINTMHAACSKK